jgi:hypothetical protein
MELVELLPTQGSIRVGPVQVTQGGTFTNLPQIAGQDFDREVRLESFDLHLGLNDRRAAPEPVEIGGSPAVATLPAGETLQLDLLWRSLLDHPGVFIVNATLDDDEGFRWAYRETEPDDRMYPSWMWSADELVRDQIRLEIPAEVPPGRYLLHVKLLDRGRPLPIVDGSGTTIDSQATIIPIEIKRSESQARERDIVIAERKRQKLTDDVEIVGNNLGEPELTAGGSLDLALIWHAIRDVPKEYEARIRLVGPGDKDWGGLVTPLAGAANPSAAWEKNDIFRGQYRIPVDRAAGPGEARLVVELREKETGKVVGRTELGRVQVKAR